MSHQATQPKLRCAIYTRKSLEEGLDQEFNTLVAQRESAESYIASQKSNGWVLVPTRYDDGGFSGGNLQRPAFKQLQQDVEDGLIDCVVVYKVDRLSRSIMDFTSVWEQFEKHGVDFVSVTEQFNTSTPSGRLQLHMILSFAQYERELISERTRDKMSAARRKGKFTGGPPPLGYDIVDKKLIVNSVEAKLIQRIYKRYVQTHSAFVVIKELNDDCMRTKAFVTKKGKERGGHAWTAQDVYKILNNPLYVGEVHFKNEIYQAESDAIVEHALYDESQAALRNNSPAKSSSARISESGFLDGLVQCTECGSAMTPSNSTKKGVKYRYYRCVSAQKCGSGTCSLSGIPVADLEKHVFDHLKIIFADVDMIERILGQVQHLEEDIERSAVLSSLRDIGAIWDELFAAEQQRIASLLIQGVEVGLSGVALLLLSGET
ncbi:MAG: recombinase family protein, partial [Planctomycetes bacterium]|nr:recombinase family protein [Planctomycetota bacterium]